MKHQVRTVAMLFGVSALFGTAALVAQGHYVTARVPFAFHVENVAFPAGTYRLAEERNGVLEVSANGKSIVVLASARSTGPGKYPHLTFKRYGNQYFLSQVWMPDQPTSMNVPQTKHEKELAKGQEIARVEDVNVAVE